MNKIGLFLSMYLMLTGIFSMLGLLILMLWPDVIGSFAFIGIGLKNANVSVGHKIGIAFRELVINGGLKVFFGISLLQKRAWALKGVAILLALLAILELINILLIQASGRNGYMLLLGVFVTKYVLLSLSIYYLCKKNKMQ